MDALFKFNSKEEAISVGEQLGITKEVQVTPPPLRVEKEVQITPEPRAVEQEDGSITYVQDEPYTQIVIEEIPQEPVLEHDTTGYYEGASIEVIGYWSPDEATEPSWWILVRFQPNCVIPEGIDLEPWMVWNSDSGIERDSSMPDRRFA